MTKVTWKKAGESAKANQKLSDTALPPLRLKEEVPPPGFPGLNGLMTLAVCVVVVTALYVAREVFIPITLAVLLSFILAPLVRILRGWHFGRIPSVILAVLVALGIIVFISGVIGTQVAQLAGDIPRYTSTLEGKVTAVRSVAGARLFSVIGGLGRRFEMAESTVAKPESGPAPKPPLPVELHQPPASPFAIAEQILLPVLSPLATAAIVFIVAIFILLQQEDLRDRLIRLFGTDDLHRSTGAIDDAARRLSRYFVTQLGLNAAFGVIIGAGLLIIGVPDPVLWGIVAALFRFVPYVGSYLSAGVPLILAASVDPGWSTLLWTLALYVVVESITGQVVEPLVYGRSTGLSPVSVVVSAIFWGWLWGPVGLILSMPLTLCLVVLGHHVKRLQFFDVVLGDRPALTPVESFYQRMLAGDPDEAEDYAEILLRDRSLTSYYDEVALKGLLLAANDAQRGVLTPDQILRIEAALEGLVSELADHKDFDADPARDESPAESGDVGGLPEEWPAKAPILCVAGRGPLDRAASIMLAQLLARSGLKARIVSHETAGRGIIHSLDVTGIAMICLCYLEISGSPSHLRYLLRRLRARMPGVPVLVGIWPTDETLLNDDRLRAAVEADYFATSLHGAVMACLKVVGEDPSPRAPERIEAFPRVVQ
jgi:predicted PurR-regulated permease PerM